METKYDILVHYFLNYWLVAVVVLIAVVLIALPQIRDGLKMVFPISKRKKEFKIEYADETITFDVKLRSQDFDVVKIHATTHRLGIRAEREWLNQYYPKYEYHIQFLKHIYTKDGNRITFDIIPIKKGDKEKDIYFDITDFYYGAEVSITRDVSDYAEQKISDLYNKSNTQRINKNIFRNQQEKPHTN